MERLRADLHAINRHMLATLVLVAGIIGILILIATWHEVAIRDEFTHQHETTESALATVIANQRLIIANEERLLARCAP